MRRLNITKMICALASSIMLVGLVAGCGSGTADSDSAKGDKSSDLPAKVVIGTQEMPNDEGIAKAEGYFEEEFGVPVEIKSFDSGKDVVTALAAKSIDFGLAGSCPAALAISQNLGVEVIWIHDVLGAAETLVARGESGVKTVADLKGKTIATPFASTAHFSLLHALENAGIAEKEVTLLDMQPSEIYAAWQNGQIDATYVWDPILSSLEDATIICDSGDMAEAGYMTSNLEMVGADFAKNYPELVSAYIKAVAKAVDMYQSDQDAAIGVISKYLELDKEAAAIQMAGSIWLSPTEQITAEYFGTSEEEGVLAKNIYDTAVFLKEQGSITDVPDMSVFEEAVNGSYVEAVAK